MRTDTLVATAVDLVLARARVALVAVPWATARRMASCGAFLIAGLICGPASAQMESDSAVRDCTNRYTWSPTYRPDAGSCYNYCSANLANACEWFSNGNCYVEFGKNCRVKGGFGGWWAAVLSSAPAHSGAPVGWLDAANAGNDGRVQGWALDTAAPSMSIEVRIYFDMGTPQVRGYGAPTNTPRPGVNAIYGASGNHGFDFAIPPELRDGAQHTVDVLAVDPHNTGTPLLSGCPKSFNFYDPYAPIGYLDTVDAGGNSRIRGWALAPGDPSVSITVNVFFDRGSPQERVYSMTTNASRPDVNAAYGVSGNHGFDFEIPSVLLDGNEHWVNVTAVGPHSTRTPLLTGCPKPFLRSYYAAALVSPSGNTYDASPTLVWRPAPGATRYWVQIDNVSDPAVGVAVFTSPFDSSQVCSASTCAAPTYTALGQGPYRWNVQAQSPSGKTWANGQNFTVLAPPAPVPVSPSGASTNPTPNFTWNPAPGATRYWVAVFDETGNLLLQGDSYPSGCSGSTCTWAPGKFFTAGPYTWRVEAQSAAGKTWSGTLGFTVVGPAAAVLRSPVGNITDAVPTFTWDASAGATEYWLSVDDISSPAGPVPVVWDLRPKDEVCSGSSCSLAPGKGLAASIYRWNIQARNAVGRTWSDGRTFTVSTLPAPVPVAPSGAASAQPTYRWKPVSGATGYVLRVDDASGATVLAGWHSASANCSASDCSVTPSGALDTLGGGVYRWYVLARNSAGDGALSPGMRFFTPTWSGTKACRGTFLAADFNADGRTDRLCSHDGLTNVALSTGAGFATPAVWLDQELGSPIVADFNGDGAADVAEYDGGGKAFWVALSSGSAFTSAVPWGTATAVWTDGQTYSCGGAARTGSGNFDGNGFADVFCRGAGTAGSSWARAPGRASSSACSPTTCAGRGVNGSAPPTSTGTAATTGTASTATAACTAGCPMDAPSRTRASNSRAAASASATTGPSWTSTRTGGPTCPAARTATWASRRGRRSSTPARAATGATSGRP